MKYFLAILAGLLFGSLVNMGLILIGPSVIPLPEGIVPGDMDSLAANIHLLEPKHYLPVWLAHALGTLAGSFVATKLAPPAQRARAAYVIAALFLVGGIMMALQLEAPTWFEAADLIGAYLPMGWLGLKLAGRSDPQA
jgi:ABC-type branched-subunit amino acid transport system permease subunit